jgi:phosphate transport system substrate-binding protein
MISSRQNGLKSKPGSKLKSKWLWAGVSTLAASAVLAGCGGGGTETTTAQNPAPATPETAPPATVAKLTGAGSTFVYPIMSKWTDAYHQQKGAEINYQSVGSGAGIKQFSNQTVDFGATDAPLKDEDLKKLPNPAVHIPITAGAVVISYNLPGAPAHLKLDGKTVAGIYLGTIKKWNDPAITAMNAGVKLPNTPISVSHRSDGSGTSYIFTNYLAAVSPEWKSKVGAGKSVDWPVGLGGKGNDGVAGIVKQAPGGIGYVELAYAKQNKLPYASIKNQAGQFIEPNGDSVTQAAAGAVSALQKDIRTPIANSSGAKAYPISGFTYILVYKQQKDAAKGQSLKDFLTWANTDGQSMAGALDYAPLPKEVVELNNKALDSVQ